MLDIAQRRAGCLQRTLTPMNGFTWNKESEGWFARHKLSNGQFCMIAFYRWYYSRSVEYYVAFAVANKKKNLNGWFNGTKEDNITLKMMGRCGIEALLWCRDKLLEFEREVRIEDSMDTKICVGGADSKRFRMYERALSRYGYRKVKTNWGEWLMVKFLQKEDTCCG